MTMCYKYANPRKSGVELHEVMRVTYLDLQDSEDSGCAGGGEAGEGTGLVSLIRSVSRECPVLVWRC